MTSRRTRILAPLVATVLVGGLAACGGEDGSSESSSNSSSSSGSSSSGQALSSLTVSDNVGKEPKLTWDMAVSTGTTQAQTVVEGDGPTVKSGDLAMTHIMVANGASKKVVSSDFKGAASLLPVSDSLIPALADNLEGAKVGSRIAVAAAPEDAFGSQGNPQMGINGKDTVVFVLDVTDIVSPEPSGSEQQPAGWMPSVTESDGVPTALDFQGTPKPTDQLQKGYLVKGDGKVAESGDQIYVNYLGQVYGGDQPFDASYTRGQPFPFTLGQGAVVKGWDQGLEGVPAGSRVMLAIPPELGYGKKGQGNTIKGTDTMYFVVDVLAVQ